MALAGPDDYEAGDIAPDIVEEVIDEKFPAIYLNITYDLGSHRPVDPADGEPSELKRFTVGRSKSIFSAAWTVTDAEMDGVVHALSRMLLAYRPR